MPFRTEGIRKVASRRGWRLIREARPADLAALLALERAFPGDRLSARAFRHHLQSPRALLLVDDAERSLAGYVLLLRRKDSPWWRLYSLVRAPDAARGTGRRLLEAALGRAAAAGGRGVRLEVRDDNMAAIRLYQEFGFTLCGAIDGYYEDGARARRMRLAFDARELPGMTR